MLDLETLGVQPTSVITEIGAVKFGGGKIIDKFSRRIDIQDCLAHGLSIDGPTIEWWMSQDDKARAHFSEPGGPLSSVLFDFTLWVGSESPEMWGCGPDFDNNILGNAYRVCGLEQPWKFWNNRCYRTVKSLFPHIPIERTGVHHRAVDDAEAQARHLMKIAAYINKIQTKAGDL
jgi:exodeoxyribonuclease VIII